MARDLKAGQRVVVLLPDSIRNYLSKFVSDAWMRQHGFQQADWEVGTIGDVLRAIPPRRLISMAIDEPVRRAMALFKEHGISQIPVLDDGKLAGILTESDLLQALVAGRASSDTMVAEVMVRKVSTVALHAGANELPRIFERGEVALVIDDERTPIGIVTKMDLIEILASRRAPAVKK
mgnify:FL=1